MDHAPASPPTDPLPSPVAAFAPSAPSTALRNLGAAHSPPAPAPALAPAPAPVDLRWEWCTTDGPRLTLAHIAAQQTQLEAAAGPARARAARARGGGRVGAKFTPKGRNGPLEPHATVPVVATSKNTVGFNFTLGFLHVILVVVPVQVVQVDLILGNGQPKT